MLSCPQFHNLPGPLPVRGRKQTLGLWPWLTLGVLPLRLPWLSLLWLFCLPGRPSGSRLAPSAPRPAARPLGSNSRSLLTLPVSLSSILLCPPLACWVLAALAWAVSGVGFLSLAPTVPAYLSVITLPAPIAVPPPLLCPHFPPAVAHPLCAHLPISDLLSSWPAHPLLGSPGVRSVGISSGSSGARGRRGGPANKEWRRSASAGAWRCSRPSPHPHPRLPSWRPTPTCWRSPSLCPSSTVSLSSWPSRMVGMGPRAL